MGVEAGRGDGAATLSTILECWHIHQKKIHVEISDILKQVYSGEKRFSERTVLSYC